MTNPDSPALPDRQVLAIEAIVAGETVSEAAKRAGVSRQTVHLWQTKSEFVATLNQRRAERDTAATERLRMLLGSALENVQRSVEAGDVDVSLKVLRLVGAGALLDRRSEPTSVEDVEIQFAHERESRQLARIVAGL